MKTKTVYVVLHEGCSSTDCQASSYDTTGEAEEGRVENARGTCRSSEIRELTVVEIGGQSYVKEGDALDLAGWAGVVGAMRDYEYAEVPEPEDDDEDDEGEDG